MPKIKEHFSGVSKRQRRRLVTTNFKRLQQSITKDVELKYQETTPHLLNLNSNQCNIKPINETDTIIRMILNDVKKLMILTIILFLLMQVIVILTTKICLIIMTL